MQDAQRDAIHDERGIRTKRFSDVEVLSDLDWVLATIEALVQERLTSTTEGRRTEAAEAAAPAPDERTEGLAGLASILVGLPAARTVLPDGASEGWRGLAYRARWPVW